MPVDETTYLISNKRNPLTNNNNNNGLSTWFAVICILDVFGVFPVVTLPKAIIDCGLHGVTVIVLVCSVQIYTASLLGRCWIIAEKIFPAIQRKNRYPYAALVEVTYGKRLSKWVTFLLDLTIFGGGIPNLIVASQNIELLQLRVSDNTVDISYCFWIIILGAILCPVLWLGSPKDMKLLCSVSVVIVVSVFLLTCGCLLSSDGTPLEEPTDIEDLSTWLAMLRAYGIIAFQFDIHPSILTIQVDMHNKSQLPKALVGAFVATISMFGITTIITSLKYGAATQTSILDTLPTSVPLHFAAVLVAIQLCLTSAVSNSALYQQMEDCMSISRAFNPKRCILRTILTIWAVVIAESVPRFDLVMSLIGGTLTGPLVFILPPVMYMKILSLEERHKETLAMESFTNIVFTKTEQSKDISRYKEITFREDFRTPSNFKKGCSKILCRRYVEVGLCYLIITASIILTITTTYFNVASTISSYSEFSKPCIYNISMTLLYL